MPYAITYTEARQNLSSTMDKVCDTHEPTIITRRSAEPVVMMSLADYNAIAETAYLLKSPKNAQRLLESIEEANSGKSTPHSLIEED